VIHFQRQVRVAPRADPLALWIEVPYLHNKTCTPFFLERRT
jgi:hypothetical protein